MATRPRTEAYDSARGRPLVQSSIDKRSAKVVPCRLRKALGAAVALTVISTLATSPTAGAEPNAGQTVRSQVSVTGANLSSRQWTKAKYATKARNHAISSSGKSMDYRKMKRVYGKHSAWRRTTAAGFRQAGGEITHISKAGDRGA